MCLLCGTDRQYWNLIRLILVFKYRFVTQTVGESPASNRVVQVGAGARLCEICGGQSSIRTSFSSSISVSFVSVSTITSMLHAYLHRTTVLWTWITGRVKSRGITPWSRVLPVKLTCSQLLKIFPRYTEPECSSPYSQELDTCPYLEPNQSSLCPPHPTSRRSILILSSHQRQGFPGGLLSSGFLTKDEAGECLRKLMLFRVSGRVGQKSTCTLV
jgi:hypothetical protein